MATETRRAPDAARLSHRAPARQPAASRPRSFDRPPRGGDRRAPRPGSRAQLAPRIRLFRIVLVAVLLVVVGRLVQVQVFQSSSYQAQGRGEELHTVAVDPVRGGIYDRKGNTLAVSVPTKMVIADDFQIAHPDAEAKQLAPLLGIPVATLASELHQHSGYVPLVRHLAAAKGTEVAGDNFPGITEQDSSYRVNPDGQLAASVLGSTNAAGVGSGGLEYQYQHLLAGKAGSKQVLESPSGVVLPQTGSTNSTAAVPGSGIELTLDEGLQYETQQALASAIVSAHATSGTAVIMDVRTGQILSMANLEATPGGTTAPAPSNLAVTHTYEPGSVFKLVTFSAALQDGVINPNTTFTVPGSLTLDGSVFHDAEAHGTEQLTATQIIAQSSNIGTSEIAQQLGESRLLAQAQNLGFGQPTALHFPGESGGIVIGPSQWEPTDYVDLPIGQVDSATPLQVLDMMNSVANGGVLIQPKLVLGTVAADGSVKATPASASRRVMSKTTASELASMLQQVVTTHGTAPAAAIPGYSVAGKTGTANIPDPSHAGFIPHAYMATFAGFAPAQHPVFASVVVLDRPTPPYGGSVSAPVFAKIVGYALHHYGIPTTPGASTAPPTSTAGLPENA